MKSRCILLFAGLSIATPFIGCKKGNSSSLGLEIQTSETPVTQHDLNFRPDALGKTPALLTKHEQLDQHIGRFVAIRGTVSSTKIATIIGVDIDAGELRGKDCYAVGVLSKWTRTCEHMDELSNSSGAVATRRPGVNYSLYAEVRGRLAPAREWPKNPDGKIE